MYGVKWRNVKFALVMQKYSTDTVGKLSPYVINLVADPREGDAMNLRGSTRRAQFARPQLDHLGPRGPARLLTDHDRRAATVEEAQIAADEVWGSR